MNASLTGMVLRVGAPTAVGIMLSVLAVVAALWIAYRCLRRDLVGLAVCAIGLGTCLASPITWVHHLVWLIPTVGLLWANTALGSQQRLAVAVLALVPILRLPTLGDAIHGDGLARLACVALESSSALLTIGALALVCVQTYGLRNLRGRVGSVTVSDQPDRC